MNASTPQRKTAATMHRPDEDRVLWLRCVPYFAMHLACLGVIWVGVSGVAVAVAAGLYAARMFAITAFYHRYFSHRSFKTSRVVQWLGAAVACSAGQRGPLWWAAHHRHHHKHSDQDEDLHSPSLVGLLRSHMGWFLTRNGFTLHERYVRDWMRYPEIVWLNRYEWLPLVALAGLTYALGAGLAWAAPGLGTSGPQMLVWGFFISTIVLYHATYTINSLAHRWGSQRFATTDDSRNNLWLALVTLGEGWHNNHHHYPASARQGFYWWEVDLTYYVLLGMQGVGLIWDVRPVPESALRRDRVDASHDGAADQRPIQRGEAV